MRLGRFWGNIGPGAVIAAAFIGPGTVTTATLAGAEYGVTLLWALLFSVLATLVLQEMAARLGLLEYWRSHAPPDRCTIGEQGLVCDAD